MRGGTKSSTMSAGLTEASAIERNAVQMNGFASSLHLRELFFFYFLKTGVCEC